MPPSIHVLALEIDWMREVRGYPLTKIDIEERETYELILGLQKRKLDDIFMRFTPRELPDLTSKALLDEDMVLAIPSGHAPARHPSSP